MLKLIDILREVAAEQNIEIPSGKEVEVAQAKELLASLENLEEGALDEGKIEDIGRKLKKLGLTTAMLLALAGTNPTAAQQKAIDIAKEPTATTVVGKRIGSAVDGKIGEYTSKYRFPLQATDTLKLITKVNGKITNVDTKVQSNLHTTMISAAQKAGITPAQMVEWNKFVDWMGQQGYAGSSEMNSTAVSRKAYDEYMKVNPKFWVKWEAGSDKSADVAKVQEALQNVRDVMIEQFKAGNMGIRLGGKQMDRNNPSDVARVASEFMPIVKHVTYK